jgi:hypothetical protein
MSSASKVPADLFGRGKSIFEVFFYVERICAGYAITRLNLQKTVCIVPLYW